VDPRVEIGERRGCFCRKGSSGRRIEEGQMREFVDDIEVCTDENSVGRLKNRQSYR
jgi:hypothetical protein